jgi:hypothetical protein
MMDRLTKQISQLDIGYELSPKEEFPNSFFENKNKIYDPRIVTDPEYSERMLERFYEYLRETEPTNKK